MNIIKKHKQILYNQGKIIYQPKLMQKEILMDMDKFNHNQILEKKNYRTLNLNFLEINFKYLNFKRKNKKKKLNNIKKNKLIF